MGGYKDKKERFKYGFNLSRLMKKRLLIGLFVLLLLAWSVSAQQDCLDAITAKDTRSFLNEIPSLNAQLGTCANEVPSPADRFLKDEIVSVKIFMQDGSTEPFTVTTQAGKITDIEAVGASKPTFIVGLGECEFDTILRTSNKLGAIAYMYQQNKITLSAVGFFNRLKFGVVKLFINPVFKRIAEETTTACSTAGGDAAEKKEVGAVCQHGGECKTGNCIYDTGEGPNRIYRCSCDPFKLVTTPGCPQTPEYPESNLGQPGDICQHGGQCESGNCIYVGGAGADRVYKCSCDPFNYVPYGC